MSSNTVIDYEAVDAALTALESAAATVVALRCDGLKPAAMVEVLRRVEMVGRMLPAVGHPIIDELVNLGRPAELGNARIKDVLANSLRITPAEASRRIRESEVLSPRKALSGQPLDPEYPNTARAQRDGLVNSAHIGVISEFFRHLPAAIDAGTSEQAEEMLARSATTLRPDELRKAAERLAAHLNPDGEFSDVDRARKRDFHMGRQGPDLMSKGSFTADPELRAYLEAIFAKWAKPGMCNPDGDEAPTVDEKPDEKAAKGDRRSNGQRQHDALKAVCRGILASGKLGQHRGLPVTVIVSMTWKELHEQVGTVVTGGGSQMTVKDALRLGGHANHYLAIFDGDDGRPLYLGRTRRIGSDDQRIVLHATDRGCTFPGCHKLGILCQCHHCKEWAKRNGLTDIDQLTLACDAHHALIGDTDNHWHTRKAQPGEPFAGRTYWIPPVHVDPLPKTPDQPLPPPKRIPPRPGRVTAPAESGVADGPDRDVRGGQP